VGGLNRLVGSNPTLSAHPLAVQTHEIAIPFTLDPSILLTSNGALNPIREVARVIQIATREWKGVSSAGVTASYDAEASEVSDDTPTLAQPTITSAMGRAFVPF
jgi:predicted phage gp36 major capsid-like protein